MTRCRSPSRVWLPLALQIGCMGCDSASDVGADAGADAAVQACNGDPRLCAMAYDQVTFATTHNANASRSYGYSINANQISGLTEQLQDGIRAMMLDVTYADDGATALCHGPCSLGSSSHLDGLAELRAFLVEHPGEVVTILYEDSIAEEDLEADFVSSGLIDFVFEKDGPWPTLGQMVQSGRRLVVTTEVGSGPPNWIHHLWDVAFDTPYTFMAPDDFSCALNRGSTDNDLFLMNHWVNTSLDLPSEADARIVNGSEALLARAHQCEQEVGKRPTFVGVDFYEHGDLFDVVDALNDL